VHGRDLPVEVLDKGRGQVGADLGQLVCELVVAFALLVQLQCERISLRALMRSNIEILTAMTNSAMFWSRFLVWLNSSSDTRETSESSSSLYSSLSAPPMVSKIFGFG
jgi:hypothetical protein